MLIVAKRAQLKENRHTMPSVIVQVVRKFKARRYAVSLNSVTVRHGRYRLSLSRV